MARLPLTLSFALAAILLICTLPGFAQDDYIRQGYVKQSRLPRSLHKFQFGLSSVGAAAYYEGDFDQFAADGTIQGSHYSALLPSTGGLGVTVGTFSRLAKIGKRCAISFDRNLMYNVMYWKRIGATRYSDDARHNPATTRQVAVTLGLDVKFGSDARLEKNHKFCLSLGGGIMPSYNVTRFRNQGNEKPKWFSFRNVGAAPYVKAEAGFFWGACWKFRFLYSPSDLTFVNDEKIWHHPAGFGFSSFTMKNKSSLIVSLIVMPFSYDWPDNGWWNNSRTMGTFHRKKF